MKDTIPVAKNAYLIYTRKSTDDAKNQKNSISFQKGQAITYALANRLPIAQVDIPSFCTGGIITERHTGFKEDDYFTIGKDGTVQFRIERPKFHKMLQILLSGNFKGVIFLCWDRASRNDTDNQIIKKLMKRVDVHFVQAKYEQTSNGMLHMGMDGMFSQHYSSQIGEKVANTTRKLREDGICTYKASVGYLNLGDPRNKPFDPIRAPIIKQLFEKYDEGTWSLSDLVRFSAAQGLTMPPVRRPRTKEELLSDDEIILEPVCRPLNSKNIHDILTNPFYTGKILGPDGQQVKSKSHQALIDEALFSRVQTRLHSRKTSVHYTDKLDLPYRGLVRCTDCKRVYTPYEQKGFTYYSVRCIKKCTNSNCNINRDYIEKEVGKKFSTLGFTEAQISHLTAELDTGIANLEKHRLEYIEGLKKEQVAVQEKLAYLYENKIALLMAGTYTPQSFADDEAKLQDRNNELFREMQECSTPAREVIQDALELSKYVDYLYPLYDKAEPEEKIIFIKTAFSELTLFGNSFTCEPKMGFDALKIPLLTSGDPAVWFPELLKRHDLIRYSLQEVRALLKETEEKQGENPNP